MLELVCSAAVTDTCDAKMRCSALGMAAAREGRREADRKNVVWEVLNLSEYSLQSSVGVIRLSFNFVLHLKRRCSRNDKLN